MDKSNNDRQIDGTLKKELVSILKLLCEKDGLFCLIDNPKIYKKGHLDGSGDYIAFGTSGYYLFVNKTKSDFWKIVHCRDLWPKAHHFEIYQYNIAQKKILKINEPCPIHPKPRRLFKMKK